MALTDAQVRQAVADCLGQTLTELQSKWTNLSANGNAWAQATIRRSLLARGYSATQVTGWDDYDECNRDLGVWHAVTRGMAIDDALINIEKMDRRKDLKDCIVTVGGVLSYPEGEALYAEGELDDSADTITADTEW